MSEVRLRHIIIVLDIYFERHSPIELHYFGGRVLRNLDYDRLEVSYHGLGEEFPCPKRLFLVEHNLVAKALTIPGCKHVSERQNYLVLEVSGFDVGPVEH